MSALESTALSKTPLYHQVCNLLLQRIKSGEWIVGSFLPNEYRLSTEYGVSIGTIRSAVSMLAREGLVVRKQGRGTLVVATSERSLGDCLHRIGRHGVREVRMASASVLSQDVFACGEYLAGKLGLEIGDNVHRITRVSVLEDAGKLHDTIFLPFSLYTVMPDSEDFSRRVATLARHNNLLVDKVEERINAIKVPAELIDLLEVEPGQPVLRIERMLYMADETPIELRFTHCQLHDAFYTLNEQL